MCLLSLDRGAARSIVPPCLNDLSEDCLVKSFYNMKYPAYTFYDDFNLNMRPYFEIYCYLKNIEVLKKVNVEFQIFDNWGVIEQFDNNARERKSYFGFHGSIRSKYACIPEALGRPKIAKEAHKKALAIQPLPVTKLERADYAIGNNDLDKAYTLLSSLTKEDMHEQQSFINEQGRKLTSICFECRSLENRILENFLKSALASERFVLAQKSLPLFSKLPTGDVGFLSATEAEKLYVDKNNGLTKTETSEKIKPPLICGTSNNSLDNLYCVLLKKEKIIPSQIEAWAKYWQTCDPKYYKDCLYTFLMRYTRYKDQYREKKD